MTSFIDPATTIHYRGYEIRMAGDAIGFGGSGGFRFIIKKNGKTLCEQSRLEDARKLVDEYIREDKLSKQTQRAARSGL